MAVSKVLPFDNDDARVAHTSTIAFQKRKLNGRKNAGKSSYIKECPSNNAVYENTRCSEKITNNGISILSSSGPEESVVEAPAHSDFSSSSANNFESVDVDMGSSTPSPYSLSPESLGSSDSGVIHNRGQETGSPNKPPTAPESAPVSSLNTNSKVISNIQNNDNNTANANANANHADEASTISPSETVETAKTMCSTDYGTQASAQSINSSQFANKTPSPPENHVKSTNTTPHATPSHHAPRQYRGTASDPSHMKNQRPINTIDSSHPTGSSSSITRPQPFSLRSRVLSVDRIQFSPSNHQKSSPFYADSATEDYEDGSYSTSTCSNDDGSYFSEHLPSPKSSSRRRTSLGLSAPSYSSTNAYKHYDKRLPPGSYTNSSFHSSYYNNPNAHISLQKQSHPHFNFNSNSKDNMSPTFFSTSNQYPCNKPLQESDASLSFSSASSENDFTDCDENNHSRSLNKQSLKAQNNTKPTHTKSRSRSMSPICTQINLSSSDNVKEISTPQDSMPPIPSLYNDEYEHDDNFDGKDTHLSKPEESNSHENSHRKLDHLESIESNRYSFSSKNKKQSSPLINKSTRKMHGHSFSLVSSSSDDISELFGSSEGNLATKNKVQDSHVKLKEKNGSYHRRSNSYFSLQSENGTSDKNHHKHRSSHRMSMSKTSSCDNISDLDDTVCSSPDRDNKSVMLNKRERRHHTTHNLMKQHKRRSSKPAHSIHVHSWDSQRKNSRLKHLPTPMANIKTGWAITNAQRSGLKVSLPTSQMHVTPSKNLQKDAASYLLSEEDLYNFCRDSLTIGDRSLCEADNAFEKLGGFPENQYSHDDPYILTNNMNNFTTNLRDTDEVGLNGRGSHDSRLLEIPLKDTSTEFNSSSQRPYNTNAISSTGSRFTIYWQRWLMLFYMSLLNLLSDWTCFSVAPISIMTNELFGNVSPEALVTIFLAANAIATALEPITLHRLGLRKTVVFGAFLLMSGSVVKSGGIPGIMGASLTAGEGWRLYVGFFLVGLSQPLYQCTPALLSASWFPQKERTLATGVALNSNQLGIGCAFVFGTMLVESKDDIPAYFGLLSILSSIAFTGCLLHFDDAPATPPSETARVMRGTLEIKVPHIFDYLNIRSTNLNRDEFNPNVPKRYTDSTPCIHPNGYESMDSRNSRDGKSQRCKSKEKNRNDRSSSASRGQGKSSSRHKKSSSPRGKIGFISSSKVSIDQGSGNKHKNHDYNNSTEYKQRSSRQIRSRSATSENGFQSGQQYLGILPSSSNGPDTTKNAAQYIKLMEREAIKYGTLSPSPMISNRVANKASLLSLEDNEENHFMLRQNNENQYHYPVVHEVTRYPVSKNNNKSQQQFENCPGSKAQYMHLPANHFHGMPLMQEYGIQYENLEHQKYVSQEFGRELNLYSNDSNGVNNSRNYMGGCENDQYETHYMPRVPNTFAPNHLCARNLLPSTKDMIDEGVEPVMTQQGNKIDIDIRDDQIIRSLKACFSRSGFIHSLVAFATSGIVINTLSTYMDYLISLGGASRKYVGIIGGLFQVLIMVSSMIIGKITDKTRAYFPIVITSLVLGAFALAECGICLDASRGYDLKWSLLVVAVLVGPLQPVSTELGVDVAYPLSENTVLVIQQLFSNLLSALFIPFFQLVRESGKDAGDGFERPEYTFSFYLLIVLHATATVFFATFDGKYIRLAHEIEANKKLEKDYVRQDLGCQSGLTCEHDEEEKFDLLRSSDHV
eukprot:CAMPEP_0184862402 /NCGR_PEP_ID=MMETSP0580-20130426/6869_1 /TAXON_ID=1118495 /ORGANISM="Dactyliosolen fragilissimus" /LENGTH=1717 /DNA_ID=CAMNT_0027360257 /DNA_START=401 /DNA_END=5554 /DNA_ORIENTATION=+